MKSFIIIQKASKDHGTKFWTGTGWSIEYPDAFIFKSPSKCIPQAKLLAAKGLPVDIVENYGCETERSLPVS